MKDITNNSKTFLPKMRPIGVIPKDVKESIDKVGNDSYEIKDLIFSVSNCLDNFSEEDKIKFNSTIEIINRIVKVLIICNKNGIELHKRLLWYLNDLEGHETNEEYRVGGDLKDPKNMSKFSTFKIKGYAKKEGIREPDFKDSQINNKSEYQKNVERFILKEKDMGKREIDNG